MLELTENQVDIIKSFAIFFLLLIGNYIGSTIFTCSQINYLKKYKFIQLCCAFLLFYFLNTLLSETGKLEYTPPIQKLLYSFMYFIGFLIMMRLDLIISALIILFIFIIYFIELNKTFYLNPSSHKTDDDKNIYNDTKYWITLDYPYKIRLFKVKQPDFKFINNIETNIYYVIVILLVVGFIEYIGKIRHTLSKPNKLTWVDIMLNANISKLQYNKSFSDYFLMGIKI